MKQTELFDNEIKKDRLTVSRTGAPQKSQKPASESKKPASELMKKVAEKVPEKRKILKDFSPSEAEEIFKEIKIDAIKKSNKLSKTEKDQRELIYRTKRLAKKLEVGNKSKIILFPSYSKKGTKLKWYKMGDFSAQYYMYRMADRMGRNPSPRKDSDNFARMHVIVSIGDIDKFVEEAMKLNEIVRHEETSDKIHILYLKKGLSDEEVLLLQKTEGMQKEMMHNVLKPKKAAPEVYLTLLMLARQIINMTSSLGRIYRIEIGDSLMAKIVALMDSYSFFASGFEDTEATKRAIRRYLIQIRSGMAILGDNEAIKPDKACAIGETITKVEKLVETIK